MSDTVINDIDYGPLAALVGVWKGDKGEDLAPEQDGKEVNPYYETITFEAAGNVTNADTQTLSIVSYHQVVTRKSNDEAFHDQIGYWLWDPATDEVIQTLTIPRAVTLLAGGTAKKTGEEMVIEVKSEDGHANWGILQAPFMSDKARTTKFDHTIKVNGNNMEYREVTLLDIYGKSNFEHVDFNSLTRG